VTRPQSPRPLGNWCTIKCKIASFFIIPLHDEHSLSIQWVLSPSHPSCTIPVSAGMIGCGVIIRSARTLCNVGFSAVGSRNPFWAERSFGRRGDLIYSAFWSSIPPSSLLCLHGIWNQYWRLIDVCCETLRKQGATWRSGVYLVTSSGVIFVHLSINSYSHWFSILLTSWFT